MSRLAARLGFDECLVGDKGAASGQIVRNARCSAIEADIVSASEATFRIGGPARPLVLGGNGIRIGGKSV